ncbi:poly-gamma-glutamate hydrolase family protein [Bacillus haynesii]|uniref:poly-gamma-glutamate hydrolase family protein n=1 Tax=Bacillus haynesii TaxID=1925021 RepID=UPI00227DD2E7|nr:poly-gamma-glutamate hydrolase family protein [Bacillus haynesii]MCY7924845.1 poly-gamma-glutamate hydrolase family protein [Bacillus haynesii]MCY8773139.1 poly-gamma-glutamate hydrolase family protein [Bacillus haynesii]MCY9446468.1 poly-gamma-glutamate hydrolase family protein [Bacillus haynesii]MEC0786261.1 poly-gamma-glutamate hydrolase family protein [Bacillus haynesii]MEC1655193.1 poly-gamma-glutamate hydrolase family protein [Bacillus haynesii]
MKQALTDQYGSFTEMAENEIEGTDYSVAARDAGSALLVMAPHGGGIEPGISEIVRAFEEGFSVYLLEGLKRRGNKSLHVTSAHFDCPLAVRMAAGHRYILAFHGYDEPSRRHTLIGGTDRRRALMFAETLEKHGFSAELAAERGYLSGTNSVSINNRCQTGLSVQFEISTAQRKAMFEQFTLKGRRTSQNEVFSRYVKALKEGARIAYGPSAAGS